MLAVHRWPRQLWRAYNRLPTRPKIAVVCVCALLVASAGFGAYRLQQYLFPGTCASGASTYMLPSGPTDDCVGYTNGGYVFDPSLSAVEHAIQREDGRITSQHPKDYVSVVLLLPISATDGSIMSMSTVLAHLRGAYAAQYYANRHDVDGNSPFIQLLIGNAGYQANQWATATNIITGAVTSQHVVAVTGLGVSLTTTQKAAYALTRASIPVVGSTISSDKFDDIRNLIRVSPSNKDEISVANSYDRKISPRAFLVDDENNNDIYDSTLVTGFGKFPDRTHTIVGKETYDTSYRDKQQSAQAAKQGDATVQTQISQMIDNICTAQPAAVLFAGRGRDLAALITDLADRPCLDKHITIVTGDDVVNMPYSKGVHQGLTSNITVDYAGLASQDEWTTGTGNAVAEGRQGFGTFKAVFQGLFPGIPLTDENLMASYDATLTATSAIRLTNQQQPAPYAVAAELSGIQGKHAVLGASGPLAFNADWRSSDGSNPIGKAVPMLQVSPDGSPAFLTLNWPEGQPQNY